MAIINSKYWGQTSGQYTTAIGLVGANPFDTKPPYGCSASFKDESITESLKLIYNTQTKKWICTHKGMNLAYLPSDSK